MASFRRPVYIIKFVIAMGIIVCAAPLVDDSSKKPVSLSDDFFSTHLNAGNHLTARQNISDLLPLLLDILPPFLAFFKQVLPVLLAIVAPAIINLLFDLASNPLFVPIVFWLLTNILTSTITSSLSIDTFHGLMTNLTSALASDSFASDSSLRNGVSQDAPKLVKVMAYFCPFLIDELRPETLKRLEVPDADISKFLVALFNATQLNLTELVPKDVGAMNNLTLCFPETAKLFTSGA